MLSLYWKIPAGNIMPYLFLFVDSMCISGKIWNLSSYWRDSATRFSVLGYFMNHFSSKLLSIPLGAYPIFRKFAVIFELKMHHQCHWDSWQMEKTSIRKILLGHPDLWISLWIFEKIRNGSIVIFRGLEEDDWGRKNLKQKISLHCPFKYATSSSYTSRGPVPWVLFLFSENLEKPSSCSTTSRLTITKRNLCNIKNK
jgi:hypothetical protein